MSSASSTNYNSYWGGTSQATPLVAGIVSLLLSKNPNLTVSEVKNILYSTADDLVGNRDEDTAGFDIYMGHGRVNAFEALQQTLNVSDVNKVTGISITNPVRENLILKSESALNYANILIYSFDGKLILNKNIIINKGLNQINLPVSKGNYILEISNENYKKNFKIIKN